MTFFNTKINNGISIDCSTGKNLISFSVLIAFVFIWTGIALAGQGERILDFHSHIEVHEDGHLIVTERIEVVSAGNKIKRGIYRDFPTVYKNRSGKKMKVGFKVLGVLKNDRPEAYHTESRINGERIYIGRKNVFLKPGAHTYTITYRTDRQLGYFKDHDELYWNVTGNDWQFTIEQAGATVILPPRAEVVEATAYTGRRGAKGQAFTQSYDETGNVTFETTRPLRSGHGLTIAVAWPKGVVTEPSFKDKLNYTARDNASTIAALIGFIVLFVYYLMAWIKVGKDPRKGPIIPRFHPPDGFSPAAVRHVRKMGFDKKSFAAALVNMAVKGVLTISEDDDGVFTLEKKPSVNPVPLSRGEKKVLKSLFPSTNTLRLENKNHAKIGKAITALKKTLKTDLEKVCFKRNTKYLIPGIGITIITLAGIVLTARQISTAAFMSIWLSIWTFACVMLGVKVIAAWRSPESKFKKKSGAVFVTLFALPFFIGEIVGLVIFTQAVSFRAGIFFVGLFVISILFYHLLKAPTVYGRTVLDKIDGFRQYLSIAESERLKILNPPNKTPALFEKFLPYAMALDVEGRWGEQFADVLKQANDGSGYRAGWYTTTSPGIMDVNGLTDSLGQGLAGAVS
ncbi:MAG: DUF2207 domain-containing protein, partial [Thermodesulfobacteriota bacterium]|nr:DUF2207 domain-containing protein [Thermodesulfobacteriota bacterium]